MKQLAKKGLVKLDPIVINKKTGQPYENGFYVTCIPCKLFRPSTDGYIHLRRPFYDYYYFNHIRNQSHLTAKQLFDRKMKMKEKTNSGQEEKSYAQSMMSSYLVPKVKKSSNNLISSNENNENNNNESTIDQAIGNVESNERDKRQVIIWIITL